MRAAGQRGETSQVKGDNSREICPYPACLQFEAEYKPKTIKLTSIDLYDPNATDEDDIWKSVPPPYNADADKQAKKSLRATATDGGALFDCIDEGCACELPAKWSKWTDWNTTEIFGEFSIPAPNPPPKNLRYRANGTVKARFRFKPGKCFRIEA